ncbi:MAG: hypothetical protein K6U10_14230 [Acidobacteriia bacterium]|nr:hypothetical protein [Methyloceanibacter sp.]MCL6492959.1 hypothetical protein [Terriglobia bacterium]
MTAIGRKFFHSFPRPRPSDTPETLNARGLAILRLIKDIGLIVAPEIVEWHVPLQGGTQRSIKYDQLRICFTELHESELRQHAERFGPFALEFEIGRLRQMGALPVIYMPQQVSAGDLSAIGPTLVMEIHHVEATIRLLEQLRVKTNERELLAANPGATHIAPECIVNLRNTDEDRTTTNDFAIPIGAIRDVLSFIGFKNAPYAEMMNALGYVKSLFYPTDDAIHDEALAYYRQREWRIGRGLTSAGTVHSRSLTEVEKQRVIEVDPRFWTTEIGTPPTRRIDKAHVIPQFGDGPVTDAISRVIVPPAAVDDARQLFGDKVVSLDVLATP